MDKEKIDSVFKDLENMGMLTKGGAFRMGDSTRDLVFWIVSLLILLIMSLATLFGKIRVESNVASLVYSWFVFVITFIFGYCWKDRTRQDWFRNRLVTKNTFGLNGKEYLYSDLKKIVRSEYSENAKRYRETITLYFHSNETPIELDGDLRNRQFLLSCFPELYHNIVKNEEIELRVKFFARMLLRNAPFSNTLERDKERECVVRCLLSVKEISDLGYKAPYLSERLSFWLRQYKRDTKEKCVNDCLNMCLKLMRSESWSYAKRLELLSHFFECMYVGDGMVDDWELEFLSKISFYFVIKDWDFLSLKYRYEAEKQANGQQKQAEDKEKTEKTEDEQRTKQRERFQSVCSSRMRTAYSLLELKENATLEEVKSAYRKLVKTCHPDMLPPTVTDREKEEATVRFRSITEAYDFLCLELSAEPVNVSR